MTTKLTPEGQRLADALVKAGVISPALPAYRDPNCFNTAAALLLTAPEGEGAGLRANQLALIMSAEASAAWFTEQLNRLDWWPNRADAEAARNAINTAAQAGRRLAALTKPPTAQEPAAAGVCPTCKGTRIDPSLLLLTNPPQPAPCRDCAALTPAAPKTPDAATGGSAGDGGLPPNWLAENLARADVDIAHWSPGLRASFEATHGTLAQPAPVGEDETGVREANDTPPICEAQSTYEYDAQLPKAETPAGVGEFQQAYAERLHQRMTNTNWSSLYAGGSRDLPGTQFYWLNLAGIASQEFKALSTAPAARPGDEVDGFVLVPREPTEAMMEAGSDAGGFDGYRQEQNTDDIWRAMLAAAPAADGGRA